jgi:hypothetical protein
VFGNIYWIFKVSDLRKIAGCGRTILIQNSYGPVGKSFFMIGVA